MEDHPVEYTTMALAKMLKDESVNIFTKSEILRFLKNIQQ